MTSPKIYALKILPSLSMIASAKWRLITNVKHLITNLVCINAKLTVQQTADQLSIEDQEKIGYQIPYEKWITMSWPEELQYKSDRKKKFGRPPSSKQCGNAPTKNEGV